MAEEDDGDAEDEDVITDAEDDTEDDEVVAEDDGTEEEDDPYGEDADDMEDDALAEEEEGEDVAMDDPEVLTPEIVMPCDLTNFTLDLSEAFEFRQEGDQLIWETSEEKLMEAFQKAFNEQMGIEEDVPEEEAALAALMLDDMEDAPGCMMLEDSNATEDWLLDGCGA